MKYELDARIIVKTNQHRILQKVIDIIQDIGPKKTKVLEKDRQISIQIEEDRQTCTQTLQRMIKTITTELMRHKSSIKDIVIDSYLVVTDIKPFGKEITIPYGKTDIVDGKIAARFTDLDIKRIRNHEIERIIGLIEEKTRRLKHGSKAETHTVIRKNVKKEPVWKKDPTAEMRTLGWITSGPTKGKWFYRPQFTAVLRGMERIVLEKILDLMNFQEVVGTNLVPEEIWLKTGHLAGMPMEIYYVREPKTRNPDAWQDVIDEIKVTKKVPHTSLNALLKDTPIYGLTYAQCPVMYWSLMNKTLQDDALPLLMFDRTQNSFRYECGGRHGLERTDEFHRIELVFIGTPTQAAEMKRKLFEAYVHIFDEIMEIEWRAADVTPFFLAHAGEDKTFDEKEIGTIDFEAWLPYRGSRDSEWLEFQNLTIVGDKYAKAFNIKGQKGELWTGCTGIGLERWAIVFLAQKGLDPKRWPEAMQRYITISKGFGFC